jgi:uncharacterized protein YlxW (UPF0749 family)
VTMAENRRETGVGWPEVAPTREPSAPTREASAPVPKPAEEPAVDQTNADETNADETTVEKPVADEAAPAGSVPGESKADEPGSADAETKPGPRSGRPSFAGVAIGILLIMLGFALVTQVRNNDADSQLSTARPEDLVRILSDLDAREERLRREIAELEESKRQLESGAQGREAALTEARRRAEALGILAGTLPAEGPGLDVTFAARDQRIKAESILDAVEELRGAGAEAMQISGSTGPAVRIVAATYFVDSGEGIVVDGVQLAGPYTLLAIGDPQTMQTALNIPGGVVDAVRQRGGNVTMREPAVVRVSALHNGEPLRHARPVS